MLAMSAQYRCGSWGRYIILQLGLAGPLLQIAKTLVAEIKRIGTDKLRAAFADVPEVQRRLADPVKANASAMEMEGLGAERRRKGDLLSHEMLEK